MDFIAAVGLLFVFVCVIIFVKMKIDELKGRHSAEKGRIAEIVAAIVPNAGQYSPLYAYWYNNQPHSKSFKYYAVGFSSEQLYAAPLSFNDGQIEYDAPLLIEKQNLGQIGTVINKGAIHYISFYDKEQNELLSIWVEQSNTRLNKDNPVNIQQKKEANEFMQLMYQWMADVNTTPYKTKFF